MSFSDPIPRAHRSVLLLAAAGLLAVFATPPSAAAQRGGRTDDSGWDTTRARGDAYDLVFETSEGTFMSLDVSRHRDQVLHAAAPRPAAVDRRDLARAEADAHRRGRQPGL